MAPQKGNQFWKLRSKHGRDKLFAEPHLLKEACEEYFEWVEDNPLSEARIFCSKDGIKHGNLEKMRAMTLSGLCIYLDMNQQTWRNWRKGEDEDFVGVVTWADEVIYTQKFTGAAADMLNPNIIARDLNLRDGSDIEFKDKTKPKEPLMKNLTEEQLDALELLAPTLPADSEES